MTPAHVAPASRVWWQPVLIGLTVWLVACLLPLDGDGVGWIAGRFVLLAVLVWVPLALRLVDPPEIPGGARRWR